MHFAIRFLTHYRYDGDVVGNVNALRVQARRPTAVSAVDEFTVRLTPEARLHRHADYFGTEVVEFEISRPHDELTIDVRARVTTQPPTRPSGAPGRRCDDPAYREAGGEFLLQTDDAPGHPLLVATRGEVAAAPTPLAAVLLVSELIPDRFEYRQGATYVDSPLDRPARRAARRLPGLRPSRAQPPSPPRHRGPLCLRLPVRGTDGGEHLESVEVDTHAWIEALLPSADGETDLGRRSTRQTAASPASGT